MQTSHGNSLRLAILGGGLTGAVLAIHAIEASRHPLAIHIVEPGATLGRGIAYGTPDPAHRINVPSARMSLFPDQPDHWTQWLFATGALPDAASTDANDHHYVARHLYGAYAADTLARAVRDNADRVTLIHHRARATGLHRAASGWRIDLDGNNATVEVDRVALCCGHAAPEPPCPISPEARANPGLVTNPWGPDGLARIGPDSAVLVVGTGLTMADVLSTLDRAGHRGPVTAVSRRGLLARPHGQFVDNVDLLGDTPPPRTALGLLRLVRARVKTLSPSLGWQPVADALRSHLPELWGALPPHEKRRVVKRLLPFWEVHRFRIAPQPHDLLEREMASGRLRVERASLVGVEQEGIRLKARLRIPRGGIEQRAFDVIVLCTGPGRLFGPGSLAGQLVGEGEAQADAIGLGLATDGRSRVFDRNGRAQPTLWAFGPITRGTFGEMTGAPDIIRHIVKVVPDLLAPDGAPQRPEEAAAVSAAR